jgi:hypothetical protein
MAVSSEDGHVPDHLPSRKDNVTILVVGNATKVIVTDYVSFSPPNTTFRRHGRQ